MQPPARTNRSKYHRCLRPSGLKVIVGYGYDASGEQGWMAIIPEPSSAALAVLGLLSLLSRRRHWSKHSGTSTRTALAPHRARTPFAAEDLVQNPYPQEQASSAVFTSEEYKCLKKI